MSLLLALAFPQISFAQGFTGTEFLTWSEEAKNNYISNAVTIATMVASRSNPPTATCLDNWFAQSDAVASQRVDEILTVISSNAEFHPGGVIVLVLEGACGSFAP